MSTLPEAGSAGRILIVDDDSDIRYLLRTLLGSRRYTVLEAESGPEALEKLNSEPVDLVLLDLNIPGLTGYDVLRQIKATERIRDVPVIFLSARTSAEDKVQGLELGAVDYVSKPFNIQELLVRVAGALRVKATLDRLMSRSTEFERLSFTDPLTGLYNRRYLEERLDPEIARSQREATWVGCLMVDIDHFKSVNDRFGHPAGDTVLASVARVLTACVRSFDLVARYGGEEFVIVLPGTNLNGALVAGEKLRAAVASLRIGLEGHPEPISVTVSVGAATYGGGGEEPPELIERADEALLEAKRGGRNRVVGARR